MRNSCVTLSMMTEIFTKNVYLNDHLHVDCGNTDIKRVYFNGV